jgi:nucleoside-diphosphate-sugar epimerase
MDAPSDSVKVRTSYNLAGCSFTPEEIANAIQKHIPEFVISYTPDFRQAIADSWPNSIDDSVARTDWGWNSQFDLTKLVRVMLENVKV